MWVFYFAVPPPKGVNGKDEKDLGGSHGFRSIVFGPIGPLLLRAHGGFYTHTYCSTQLRLAVLAVPLPPPLLPPMAPVAPDPCGLTDN